MHILVTGSQGFLGKNILAHLSKISDIHVTTFDRSNSVSELDLLVSHCDAILHLAGENRPINEAKLIDSNVELTKSICDAIRGTGKKIPIIFASSIQAGLNNPYGKSKLQAENTLKQLHAETNNPIVIIRLPGIFGKWCKPNYNSVVSTFCHNIANDIPIQIHNENYKIELVYVDDVIRKFIELIRSFPTALDFKDIEPRYIVSIGELAQQIYLFKNSRENLLTERVGCGFVRALYSTYLSYLPPGKFSYDIPSHADSRGSFFEVLKTPDCGQFSYFTAHPGVTRGGHYHHTKTEKFLVISGSALFKFRHIVTNQVHEILASGAKPKIVETIPGWAHNITNIGSDLLVVMLWANEIFNRERSDTVSSKV
jgi:UDP-2-acetamido-2,6-beta-L-arabino-hexul-4-ose reductase